jgi:ubiquinone/menaquinone biosynthesis C-methylase UbiE
MTGIIMTHEKRPPVIDYEGSDYQTRFWAEGNRDYEDRCEAIALKTLLPSRGKLMLELGAGAGRNTLRYHGFERIVLLDYSTTQLRQAQERLGTSERYIFVAADIYRLPFVDGLFDAGTMIRTLHHMADARAALMQVGKVLQPGATFILEYANKQNLKAILRFILHKQTWNPFRVEPVEFAPLNFDFHPSMVRSWLHETGFQVEKTLAVSHFRVGILKRTIPANFLASLDALIQWTGVLWQFTPSVFIKARMDGDQTSSIPVDPKTFFKCPECGNASLTDQHASLSCSACGRTWKILDGIYDFRGDAP